MTSYFVTIDGKTYSDQLTKERAVKTATRLLEAGKEKVGIGKTKIVKGERVYTLLPVGVWLE